MTTQNLKQIPIALYRDARVWVAKFPDGDNWIGYAPLTLTAEEVIAKARAEFPDVDPDWIFVTERVGKL